MTRQRPRSPTIGCLSAAAHNRLSLSDSDFALCVLIFGCRVSDHGGINPHCAIANRRPPAAAGMTIGSSWVGQQLLFGAMPRLSQSMSGAKRRALKRLVTE